MSTGVHIRVLRLWKAIHDPTPSAHIHRNPPAWLQFGYTNPVLFVDAALPLRGVTPGVKAGEDNNRVAIDHIEDATGKPPKQRPPHFTMYNGVELRRPLNDSKCGFNRAQELYPKLLSHTRVIPITFEHTALMTSRR